MYRLIAFSNLTITVIFFFAASAAAQIAPAERSSVIDVRMHLVLGSGAVASGAAIPKLLEPAISALRRDTGHKSFTLLDMQMGQIADKGTIESRGVIDLGPLSIPSYPAYSEFRIQDTLTSTGTAPIMMGSVQSGLRMPIRAVSGPQGTSPVVNYENIGYVGKRISLMNAVPTVVGSYSLPGGGGTIYLVLTATRLSN